MKKDVFDYADYKAYVLATISAKPKGGRGVRGLLASAIGSPTSHVSQVLRGDSHFTPEQAEGVNIFFGHTADEANFFLLLVQLARAGSRTLKKRLEEQVAGVLQKRLTLKERLKVESLLTGEDQATFYSSWLFGAVHVMLSIEKFQTKEAISQHLGISLKRVSEILEFLVSIGLAVQSERGRYLIGAARLHLGHDSTMISKFHTNWRMKAIASFDRENAANDLHYSSVVTLSKSDFAKIRSSLVKHIEEIASIVKDSKEEEVACFSLDLFGI